MSAFAMLWVSIQTFFYLDEQRMKIVEMGGAQKIVDMLSDAKDDAQRKEALNAIIVLARVGQYLLSVLHFSMINQCD